MASKLENLSALFSNVKMRTVIIMTVVVLLLVMIIGFFSFRRNNAAVENSAQLAKARNLQSVPGLNPTSPQYAQIQQQVNDQNYQAAQQNNGTAIPTVIHASALKEGNNPSEYELGGNSATNGSNSAEQGNGADSANASDAASKLTQAQLKAYQDKQKAEMEAMQKKLDALSSQQMQQDIQQTQQSMQREAQQLMAAWTANASTPTQQYVQGSYKALAAKKANLAQADGSGGWLGNNMNAQGDKATAAPVIKAGAIYFGVLETAVNSDEPGPIMVHIATGPYKGSRLIGSIQNAQQIPGTNGPDKLILNFNTMSIPSATSSVSVSAVAIDPDTARTALASEVNYHYLQRYGSLFGSAFLEGWGQAVAQAGSTTTTNLFGTTNTQYGKLSGTEEVLAGLGQVGQSWGQQIGEVFRRKPTVVINAGVSVGVLFLSDVTLSNVVPPAGSVTPLTLPLTAADMAKMNIETVKQYTSNATGEPVFITSGTPTALPLPIR